MRVFTVIALLVVISIDCALALGSESPLRSESELVSAYAERMNLPKMRTIEIGGGVKLEVVLIPAGQFIMGTPPPTLVNEELILAKIIVGQAVLASSLGLVFVFFGGVVFRAIRKRCRPKVSLARLVLITATLGIAAKGGLQWRQSLLELRSSEIQHSQELECYSHAADNEKLPHPVTLSRAFYLGKFDVTQEQYLAVIGSNPSQFRANENPVDSVSWDDANLFCKKLTDLLKQSVRLPTEHEWEYACRAGTTTAYYGSNADLDSLAWYDANSNSSAHPVGQKRPNAFGLYDMHGNVWQWCEDWYSGIYFENTQSRFRVIRGGSWCDSAWLCRSAVRFGISPGRRHNSFGFRVAMDLAE